MPAAGCCGIGVAVVEEDGFEGETASPAFGGGGIGDEPVADAVAGAGAVGFGTAPGCGGGGECVEVVVAGSVVVGVAVRVLAPTLPV